MRPRLTPIVALSCLLVAGCGPKAVRVPPGFTPLEETNKAALPMGTADDPHPEAMNTAMGHDDDKDYDWGHGQGYLHFPIAQVWRALKDPCVVTKHEDIKSYCVTAVNPDKDAQVSFNVTFHSVNSAAPPFDAGWRQFATEGTKDAPEKVVSRDDLLHPVDFAPGFTVMTTVSDSVILSRVDDNTTAIAHIRHLQVAGGKPADAAAYCATLFDNLKSVLHGKTDLCAAIVGADDPGFKCQ